MHPVDDSLPPRKRTRPWVRLRCDLTARFKPLDGGPDRWSNRSHRRTTPHQVALPTWLVAEPSVTHSLGVTHARNPAFSHRMRGCLFGPREIRMPRRRGAGFAYWFKDDATRDLPGDEATPATKRTPRTDPVLVCRRCGHTITSPEASIEVDGSHTHHRINPDQIGFNIACYRVAPGATAKGLPQWQFTWFPGFAWQIALCRGCAMQLGWAFTTGRTAAVSFWALIPSRLQPLDRA